MLNFANLSLMIQVGVIAAVITTVYAAVLFVRYTYEEIVISRGVRRIENEKKMRENFGKKIEI